MEAGVGVKAVDRFHGLDFNGEGGTGSTVVSDHNRAGGAGQKRRNGARDGFQVGGRLRFRGCNG
jgi:hypothetical protein